MSKEIMYSMQSEPNLHDHRRFSPSPSPDVQRMSRMNGSSSPGETMDKRLSSLVSWRNTICVSAEEKFYRRQSRKDKEMTTEGKGDVSDIFVNRQFGTAADEVGGMIGTIYRSVANFDGYKKRFMRRPLVLNARKSSEPTGDEEEGEAFTGKKEDPLAKRLKHYKYHRTVDAEPPALDPGQLPMLRKKCVRSPSPPLSTVRFSLDDWKKENRGRVLDEKISIERLHEKEVLSRANDVMKSRYVFFQKWLAKMDWKELANRKLSGKEERIKRAQEWITHMLTVTFIVLCDQFRKVKHMPITKLAKNVNSIRRCSKVFCAPQFKVSLEVAEILDPEPGSQAERVAKFAIEMLVQRVRIHQARRAAHIVFDSLKNWHISGRLLFCFSKYTLRVRIIQSSWRGARKRINELNQQISARWIPIEYRLRAIQLNEAPPPGVKREKNELPLEERVSLAMVPDKRRMAFIAHQMTGKRYKLLWRLYEWKKEYNSYKKEVKKWQEQRRAYRAIGQRMEERPPDLPPSPTQMPNLKDIEGWLKQCMIDPYTLKPHVAKTLNKNRGDDDDGSEEEEEDEFAFLKQPGIPPEVGPEDIRLMRSEIQMPERLDSHGLPI